MSGVARKLFDEALALPRPQRAALLDALADSLVDGDQTEVTEAWRLELLRRVHEVRDEVVTLESADDVRKAGRDALSRR